MKLPAKFDRLVIGADNREQTPWEFDVELFDVRPVSMQSADYCVIASPDIVVERKSLPDLLGCCTSGRERFERELKRLRSMTAIVIVEASWSALSMGQWRSRVSPKSVQGSVMAWQADVPFLFAGNRSAAAEACARWLWIHANRRWREGRALIEQTLEAGQ